MDCRDARRQVTEYAAGRLAPDAWHAMREHLRGCQECRQVLGRVDSLAGLAARLPDAPVPVDLSRHLLAAARARQAARAIEWNPLLWWRMASLSLRWATLTLGLIGLLLGGATASVVWSGASPDPWVAADPLERHAIDYLADAPDGSLAGSYLALQQGGGEERE